MLSKIKKMFSKKEEKIVKTVWDSLHEYILSYDDIIKYELDISNYYSNKQYIIPYNNFYIYVNRSSVSYSKKDNVLKDYIEDISNFLPQQPLIYCEKLGKAFHNQEIERLRQENIKQELIHRKKLFES